MHGANGILPVSYTHLDVYKRQVMQSVDLYDTVAVERTGAGGGIRLTCSDDRLPTDETNLADVYKRQ